MVDTLRLEEIPDLSVLDLVGVVVVEVFDIFQVLVVFLKRMNVILLEVPNLYK